MVESLDPTSKERLDQQSMTHYAPQPDPAASVLEAARRFPSQGLTGSFPALRQAMPGWVNTIGDLVQSPVARDVFSTANVGGVPLMEAAWSPRDLGILKTIYGADIHPSAMTDFALQYLPGRSKSSIWQKANELGITKPPTGPYVRQPGSPSIANDPDRVAQIDEMMKKGLTFDQMTAEMGDVSSRSLRRYVNENLKTRLMKPTGPNTPGMPSFNLPGESVGDPEYEKALADFLQSQAGTKGYARGGIVEEPMAGLSRGIAHYQGGTDDTGVVPKQTLQPPSLFQQVLQALQPAPRAIPQVTSEQLQQLNQLMPIEQGWSSAPLLQLPGESTGFGQLLRGQLQVAQQNPEASPATAAIAGFLDQQNKMRRASAVATPPGPLEWMYHLFAGRQGDTSLSDRAAAATTLGNPVVQQHLINNPDHLAAAEQNPVAYVQTPAFKQAMQTAVNNHVQAANGIPQPDGTLKTSDDPGGLARLANTAGATVDQTHPFHESHNYNDDELVRAISSIPKGVVNRILEAQFGRAPSVQEQITQATYAALQADYTNKQKAFNDALALKKPIGGLQKDRDDAYKALHDFTLEVSRGASLMPPG